MAGEVEFLVSGAGGFVGHALCDRLESDGRRFIAVDRVTTGRALEAVCELSDVTALSEIVRSNRPATIVHCGGISGPMLARENPLLLVHTNIVGTANMLEAARLGGARFVYCSSAGAYGNTPPAPVAEDTALHPTDLYGASKAAGELLVAAFALQFGIDAVSLRISWVYGPRRTTACLIRTMLVDAIEKRPTVLPFGQAHYRQFVHVDDVVAAILLASERRGLPGQVYNIAGGTRVSFEQVAAIVRQVFPLAEITLGPGPDPEDDVQEAFDLSAAARDLHYFPRVELEAGVRSYAEWLQTHPGFR